MEDGRLPRSSVPAVSSHQDDEDEGHDRAGSPYREDGGIFDIQPLSANLKRSFRARFHLRHAEHDVHEVVRPPSGRNSDREAAGETPPRDAHPRARTDDERRY